MMILRYAMAHALTILGWTVALINWARVRHLERMQEELLRRLTAPPRRETHRSMGAMLLGLVMVLFVAWRYNHWLIQYGEGLLAILGWAGWDCRCDSAPWAKCWISSGRSKPNERLRYHFDRRERDGAGYAR